MKRWYLASLLALACNPDGLGPNSDQTRGGSRKDRDHRVAIVCGPEEEDPPWYANSNVWTIAKASCRGCHQYVGKDNPAEVDLKTRYFEGPTGFDLGDFYSAIVLEKAPANRLLSQTERETFLAWMMTLGFQGYTVTVPLSQSWSMATQIGAASDGSQAAQAGKFFGFRVEDNKRTSNFKIATYSDRNGVSKKCIEFEENVAVDQDSFNLSQNPTNYIFIDGLAWNGRWRLMTASGYVVQSRWLFIGFHTREMKKGASPTQAREPRDYVRLQVDRDWVSWRGKKPPADATETYPWNGADPWLTANGEGLNDGVFLNDDEWYRVDVVIADTGDSLRYYATVKTVSGTLKAEVSGRRYDDRQAYGTMFFGSYSTNGTGKKDRFAEWTATVSDLVGEGSTQGLVCN